MATGIEWVKNQDGTAGETWNPLAGCKEISPGCTNCYAAVMAKRLEAMGQKKYEGTTKTLPNGKAVWTGKIVMADEDDSDFRKPLKRKKPTMYFVNSMSDLFHKDVPFFFIDKVFAVMAMCPQHTFQVLTKRPERMAEYFENKEHRRKAIGQAISWMNGAIIPGDYSADYWCNKVPMPNVWLGTSVEDQLRANERIPHLLRVPAAIRFLSCEPLLGPLVIPDDISWVIVGGESGHGARYMEPDWARSIRDQCARAETQFFMKQMSAKKPIPTDLFIRQMPTTTTE